MVSFTSAVNFGVGTAPVSVAVGDFNGDGNKDIVTTNATSDNVSVLLGDGTGNFAPAVNYNVGDQPRGVAIGDFNGDGRNDLAVTNFSSNTVSILLNNGSGSFTSSGTYTVGNAPVEVAIADFNGDGKSDMVIVNDFSGTLTVLYGNGSGGFPSSTTLAIRENSSTVDVGDLNGDGKLDIVSASAGPQRVWAFLGDGTGGFTPSTNLGVNSFPNCVRIADFNNDGKADIATTNASSGTVSIFLGNGNGTFTPTANFAAGSNTTAFTTADFNGDGKTDIAVASNGTGNILVLLGDGTGNFDPAVGFPTAPSPYELATGDFNNDGKVDLVSANPGSSSVSVLLNTTGIRNTAPTDLSLDTTKVNENVAANTTVGTFSTTDVEGGTFTYELVTGDGSGDNSAFAINGNTLKILNSPNFETKSSYNIRVKTTDAGGLSYEKAFTIGVIDVNEAPTAVNLANTLTLLAENTSIATPLKVADINVSDDALGTNILSLSGTDASFFEIDGNGLFLKPGTSLDFETKPSYAIAVNVNDATVGGTPDASTNFILSVGNVNEAPTATGETVSTSQNIAITVDVSDNLSDPDNNGLVGATLKVTSATKGTTSIDQDTQLITFTPTAGFSGTASFKYTVTDAGGLTSNEATVTVEVGSVQSTGNKDQYLTGNDGNDYISSGNGKDTIFGLGGNDTLLGNNGADTIDGGNGNDLIDGGNGPDVLTGGGGSDRFVLKANSGGDTITDFIDTVDRLALSGGLTFGQLTIASSNANTLIQLGTTTLATLTGVNANLITAADFITL